MMDEKKRTDRTRDLIHGIITKREFISEHVKEAYDRGYNDAREEYSNDGKENTAKLEFGERYDGYCGYCGRLFNWLEQCHFTYCPNCGKRIIR